MTTQVVLEYLRENGSTLIFIIMFLEGLNLTGIPAVVILPAIGILAGQGSANLLSVLFIAILGSIVGNMTYYGIVLMIGPKIYDKIYNKFKGMRKSLDKANELALKYGTKACCVGRIIPGVRTVISLIAGTFQVKFIPFVGYSALGIMIWDGILILIGYIVSLIG